MDKVISKDGTPIAYERTGSGPPLLFVTGALGYRSFSYSRQMVEALAKDFTVINYDRRGRGDSGDTKPYSVQREVEDIAALVKDGAGGPPFVFGLSSGAALALEAAAGGVPIRKLAVYEPPYMVGEPKDRPPPDYRERMERLIAEDRRDDAVKLFMRTVGVPGFAVAIMRLFPFWKGFRAVAHTLPYDAAVMAGFELPKARLAAITVPTLAVSGEKSPPTLQAAASAVAEAVPNAHLRSIPKQNHGVKPAAIAPVLREFFAA
jgi:pimeloyl-ACP methyl ester carboxylesterase